MRVPSKMLCIGEAFQVAEVAAFPTIILDDWAQKGN